MPRSRSGCISGRDSRRGAGGWGLEPVRLKTEPFARPVRASSRQPASRQPKILSPSVRRRHSPLVRRALRVRRHLPHGLHHFIDRPFELRIGAFGLCRIFVHANVGSTPWPSANHWPFGSYIRKVGTVTPPPSIRSGDTADPDEPSPRARADERPESRLAEVERESVAARSAPSVDQHHLGSAVSHGRPLLTGAVAHAPVAQERTVQELDEAVRDLSAAVEPLVDDQRLLRALRDELPHELVLRIRPVLCT